MRQPKREIHGVCWIVDNCDENKIRFGSLEDRGLQYGPLREIPGLRIRCWISTFRSPCPQGTTRKESQKSFAEWPGTQSGRRRGDVAAAGLKHKILIVNLHEKPSFRLASCCRRGSDFFLGVGPIIRQSSHRDHHLAAPVPRSQPPQWPRVGPRALVS